MPSVGDMYYFESQNGADKPTPLVLIHGAGGTHLHWPHNLRRLTSYRVLAPDLPGHGKSEGLGHQTINGYVEAIVSWLTDIGISKAIFVGHSMGGAIVQTLALEYPEHVVAIGLVSTGARLKVNADLLDKIAQPATFPKAVELVVQWSYAAGVDSKLIEQVKKQLLDTRPSVVHGDYQACNNFNMVARVKEISVPTCIICGQVDRMTPPRFSEYLAEQIPNADLTLIPESGHMVMIEQTEPVTAALEEFLNKNINI